MSDEPITRPRVLSILERLATALALLAGAAILVLAILISVDIFGRDFFGVSLQGTDELGGYVLAFVGSLGMAQTLIRRGHPRIELFFRFFPQALADVLHVLAQLTMALFALFLAWHAAGELRETLRFGSVTNTPLQTPLWVPQAVWLAGMCFFALTACVAFAHALFLYVSDRSAVAAAYGAPTIDEEIDQYVGKEQC